MTVPGRRLIWLAFAALLPLATAGGLRPDWAAPCWGLAAALMAVAAADAVAAARRLRRFEVSAKDLRARYKTWCEEEGLDVLSAKVFGSRLVARGLERRKTNGLTWYVGMMFNAAA